MTSTLEHFSKLFAGSKGDDIGLGDGRDKSHQVNNAADPLLQPFSVDEVREALADCNAKSAPGEDFVSFRLLQNCSETVVPFLVNLYNTILTTQSYPEAWKTALLILLYKKGPRSDPANYRPIALQSCVAKLFSRLIADRLRSWMLLHSPFRVEQFGFVPGRSTIDAAMTLHTLVTKYLDGHPDYIPHCCFVPSVYATFVDFRFAFDSVNHAILFDRLRSRGVPEQLVIILKDMYTSNTLKLKDYPNHPEFFVNRGVKQGDPLSPLLFAIFIDDLISELEGCGKVRPLTLRFIRLHAILFADDTTLLALSRDEMQFLLRKLEEWSIKNKIDINVAKTKVMVFSQHPERVPPANLKILGKVIEEVPEFTYLGITLTNKLEYKPTFKISDEKAKRAAYAATAGFNRLDLASLEHLKEVYNACVVSHGIYGAELWGIFRRKVNLDSLIKLQSQYLKRTLRLPISTSHSLLFREFPLLPIRVAQVLSSVRYYFKLQATNDVVLKECVSCLNLIHRGNSRNFIAKVQKYLKEDGIAFMNLAAKENLLSPCQKVGQLRDQLMSNMLAKNDLTIEDDYSSVSVISSAETAGAINYFQSLSSHKAVTLLLIHTNSLYKPFQYLWSDKCPFCNCPKSLVQQGWGFLLHCLYDCENFNDEDICQLVRTDESVDCGTIMWTPTGGFERIGSIGHKILSFAWKTRVMFKHVLDSHNGSKQQS